MTETTKNFQGFGFDFLYPADWELNEESVSDAEMTISIESPDSSFLIISRFDSAVDAAELIQKASEAIEQEYTEIEFEDLDIEIGTEDSFGMQIWFYCMDLLVTAKLYAFTHQENTFLIQCQTVDSEENSTEASIKILIRQLLQRLDCKLESGEL